MQMILHVRVKCPYYHRCLVPLLSETKKPHLLGVQKWAVHSEVAACVIDETDSEGSGTED